MNKKHLAAAVLCTLCYSVSMHAQLLKGTVKADSISDMMITYNPNGNILEAVNVEIEKDTKGNFTFNAPIPSHAMDITVQADNDIFGAHVEQGKTATITILRGKDGQLEAKLGGDNAVLSRFYNVYTKAYDSMKYWSPDPSEAKSNSEYCRILEEEHTKVLAALNTLKDERQKAYYTRLSQGMYTWTKIRLIMDRAFDEKKSFLDYPDYVAATKDIDPNDSINMATNLSTAWLTATRLHLLKETNDTTRSYLLVMDEVNRKVSNPNARKLLTNMLMYAYSMAPEGDIKAVWNAYTTFAKDYPEMIAKYEPMIKTSLKSFNGKPLPYDPTLETTDGKTLKLSSLYGKLTYIDMWATWCGPCCKEIPHLEKVVEKYKGNDKVQFISISIDSNKQAWLNKLQKDNPAWAQYLMPQQDADKLMSLMGINGIPRFILIDPQGNVIFPDAKRPSDPELLQDIDDNIK